MSQDTLLDLSRWQWALTAAMHITFPAVTVGTSVFLVVCYAMYMRTDDEVWLRMFRFWRRIFGIGFALGVVSGIVMTFEFGLNWGPFAHDVGPILGVLIAMEVVTAFFLEAGFLGLLVYGDGRIGRRMMMFSTCMCHSARPSRSPGSWSRIRGCRPQPGTSASTASFSQSTGCM
jgi:cytochrome d ubiquinol oxidase subunit I